VSLIAFSVDDKRQFSAKKIADAKSHTEKGSSERKTISRFYPFEEIYLFWENKRKTSQIRQDGTFLNFPCY